MEALAEFQLLRPTTLAGVLEARAAHPGSQLLGGGTDLIVNLRRGIVTPPVLVDMNGVEELRTIRADTHGLEVGASVTLAEVVSIASLFPARLNPIRTRSRTAVPAARHPDVRVVVPTPIAINPQVV